MSQTMLQHGDFFDDPAVAVASVLQECLAAAEELRGSFAYTIVGDSGRFDFLPSSIPPAGNICVHTLVVATDFSVLDP